MEFHTDHEVRLNDTSEHKSLYQWSLQEVSKEGAKIGIEQIPWPWSLYFTAHRLEYSRIIELEKPDDSASDNPLPRSSRETEVIYARLRSGFAKDGKTLEDEVRFSMFGTRRAVDDFSLRIIRLDSAGGHEKCHVWGCVSYTSEVDFSDETVDDMVEISIVLSPERFDRLREMLTTQKVVLAKVKLKGVSGFYSEWSPSISTDSVKILTANTDQELTIPEGCAIKPPRLGGVQEFSLTVTLHELPDSSKDSRLVAGSGSNELSVDSDAMVLSTQGASVAPAEREMSALLARTLRATSKLVVPLWLIVILLIVQLLR